MKKIKKIILVVIVSLIALISVFSCFKGKYTPEPILTPVSVLKPANSTNDNVISPTGTYEYLYFNTSYDERTSTNSFSFLFDLEYNIPFQTESGTSYIYPIIYDSSYRVLVIQKFPVTLNNTWGYEMKFLNLAQQTVYEYFIRNSSYFEDFTNPYEINITGLSNVVEFGGVTYPVGEQNHLLTNIISPDPFLFEGTSSSIAWTSSGLDNPNNIQNIYFNTNLTNQAIKNILDTYIGETAGVDIFYYLDAGVRVRCYVINNSANAFIQIIGGTTTLYKWIYDSIDTDESIWWYGIDPAIIDNGNVIISPRGNSLNGFNIYELRCLFSSANDFTETPSGDSYEQGYRDGYTAGETAGYNSGYTAGETAGYNSGYTAGETAGQTAGYNSGYTEGQTAGYNQGYLDGLDDGAGSNVNFQYIESVLTLIGNFLNIEILPNIKLSYALGIIIILSIISIIKMVVK